MGGKADCAGGTTPREAVRAHWAEIARRWAQLGPPLRPHAQDVAFYADAAGAWTRDHGPKPPRGLILGVTPELYDLPWPDRSRVLAVDHAPAMIRAVWHGPRAAAVCSDWTALPLADASRDVVLCDGGLLLLPYPDGLRALAHELARVIAPRGVFAVRLFVPPAEREPVAAVLEDLFAGHVANLNVLKVRLWTALQADAAEGVPLRRVWEALHAIEPDLDRLATRLGWPAEHLRAIHAYRDSSACYHVASTDEIVRVFCHTGNGSEPFACVRACVPTYELGDRCPTVVLRRV